MRADDRQLRSMRVKESFPRSFEFAELAVRTGIVLAVYYVLDSLLVGRLRLPEAAYYNPIIAVETIRHLAANNTLLIGSVGFIGLLVFRFKTLSGSWSEWGDFRPLRAFVTLVTFILAWYFSTYDYNLYFDQAHYIDRALLIVMVPLVFWRPIFVLPFLVVLVPIIWQFAIPVPGFSWAQQNVPVGLLLMFLAVQLVRSVWKRDWTVEAIFLGVCLVAGHYWVPGMGKLLINWEFHDQVNLILPATYSNGWLAMVEPETIARITKIAGYLNPLLRIVTLIVELGLVVAFWRRNVLIALLSLAAAYHLGVWGMSGIFFWKWIVVDLGLIGLLVYCNRERIDELFVLPRFAVAVVVIVGASVWFAPVNLTWRDTPVNYAYRIEGVAESGERYNLHPRFFEPYDYQFSLSGFHFLDSNKNLGIVWGASRSAEIVRALNNAESASDVEVVEESLGQVRFDESQKRHFDNFLRTFLSKHNGRHSSRTPLTVFHSIPQLWTFASGPVPDGSERIVEVNVYRQTTFFDGNTLEIVSRRRVSSIKIE